MSPRLLDLFCGAGGAAVGYHRAGFEVVGVDINPQPNYPFEAWQVDALEVLERGGVGYYLGGDFDAIHASPPCQAYSQATAEADKHPDLYAVTRNLLNKTGLPYVLENVIGAPYDHGIVLCGSMFGLEADGEWIQRHRNFETSFLMFQPSHHHPQTPRAITVTGHCFLSVTKDCGKHSRQPTWETACKAMDIDWMTRKELVEAIPPAYTEYIGQHLIQEVKRGQEVCV